MKNSYGNTWWGQQWLNSLSKIDNSNRLPRGKTYANKGAVTKIDVKSNQILASVQGSAPRPYKITIGIPTFSDNEKREILHIIQQNPLFLSQLLNRELPVELDDAIKKVGVHIFPKTWRSFDMKCSCPDYAVPCKHLAAVLYIVANEIDKNPFMVFEMHAFDLLKAMEQSGFSSEKEKMEKIPSVRDFFSKEPIVTNFQMDIGNFHALDFSKIEDSLDSLSSILSAKPVFYPQGDFKETYIKTLKSVAKEIGRDLNLLVAAESNKNSHEYEVLEKAILHLSMDYDFQQINFLEGKTKVFKDLLELTQWLMLIPAGRLLYCSPYLIALHTAYKFAMKLLAKSAIIPQIMAVEAQKYVIRWIPALLNEEVKKQFGQFKQLVPPDMVHIQGNSNLKNDESALTLLSVFINEILWAKAAERNASKNEFYELFFEGYPHKFSTFEERESPNAINLWLSRFYLLQKDYLPLIKVEDCDDGFEIEVLVENKKAELAEPISLLAIFHDPAHKGIQLEVMKNLSLLTEHFPALQMIIASKGKQKLLYNSKSFVEVFFKILPIMKLLGIQIMLPKALNKLFRPQVSMSLDTESVRVDYGTSVLSMENLMRFNWAIALGSQQITPEEFLKMVKGLSGIVQMNGEYVFLDEKEIQSILKKMQNPPNLSTTDLLQVALAEEYDGTPIQLTKNVRQLMSYLMSGEGLALPNGLEATLRAYQHRGFEWLYKNTRLGFGSIIADDMGLGKTLQVITTLLKLKEDKTLNAKHKALVVVPTTLLTNWQKEIMRFAPSLNAYIYHGSGRKWEINDTDVVISTYGVVRSENSVFSKEKWAVVVIDEAQNIKNPNTEQAKAIKKVNAIVKIAMSGTPVENRLSEYWSIFDFSNKGYLKTLARFKEDFAYPIEVEKDQSVADKFKKVTAPFILRRLKSDKSIINDLPDKVEMNEYCDLTKEQAALYQNVVAKIMPMVEKSDTEPVMRQGLILKLLTSLKQVCNHPTQFLKKGKADVNLSGKSAYLLGLLENILENDEKVLIFTQYTEMGELLCQMIESEIGIQTPFLHGGLSRNKRDELVENFQTKPNNRILILSLKAGGTGLNLTAANHVIHYDLWWNPAVEAQATDRAYRIGQKKNVNVHRFITQGTMEEKIDKLIQSKKELAELSVTTGESWLGDLTNKELKAIVSL